MRVRRTKATMLAPVLAGLLAVTATGCGLFSDDEKNAKAAAKKFLDAWSAGDFAAAGAASDAPDGPREWLPTVRQQLGSPKVRFDLGPTSVDGDQADQDFTVAWAIPGQEKPWSYGAKLTLVKSGDAWKVHWDTAVVHPELRPDLKLKAIRALPPRAGILDRTGQPIFTKIPVVRIGVEPSKIKDLPGLAATLASTLKVAAADIVADVKKAKPTDFVLITTLRKEQYLQVKPKIYNLEGTVFQSDEQLLAPTASFGQPLLGKVREATAEILEESGTSYAAGDVLGVSGLQRAFNRQLAGLPDVKISLVNAEGKEVKRLSGTDGKPGTPVRVTLDRGVQTAAEAALTGVPQLASIVAIKPSTGELLAVANSSSVKFDIALEGRYPPGSTFKIVTATALLKAGLAKPTSTVACPGSLAAGGKTFINADKFDLGQVPLRTAFARSCNTTFTSIGSKLPAGALTEAATQYGVGVDWKLPAPAFKGAVPPPKDATEAAANAIGQGTVLVSPLSMAVVAATLQRGSVPTPRLTVDGPVAAADAPAPLNPAILGPLRDFARAVVTEGTAKELSATGAVSGKTGTAEYGEAKPPRSHSWFAGYRGDLAFSVFIWDGASSGTPAVPIARAFLGGVK